MSMRAGTERRKQDDTKTSGETKSAGCGVGEGEASLQAACFFYHNRSRRGKRIWDQALDYGSQLSTRKERGTPTFQEVHLPDRSFDDPWITLRGSTVWGTREVLPIRITAPC